MKIQFLPEQRAVTLSEPTSLSDAAALADLLIDHPCGSRATCGKCRVRFESGAPEPTPSEQQLLTDGDIAGGWRLSCQAVVCTDALVEVPAVSRAASAKSFGRDDLFAQGFVPFIRSGELFLPEPELDYQWALEDSLGIQWNNSGNEPVGSISDIAFLPELQLDQIRSLQSLSTKWAGRLTAVFDEEQMLWGGEPAAARRPLIGIAVDVGSTSLAAAAIDLRTGQLCGSGSALNPQVQFGADVISRIDFAQNNEDGNDRLHDVLISELNVLCNRVLQEASPGENSQSLSHEDVWLVCAAGNPAMLHTFLNVDVVPLGQAPYVGAWSRGLVLEARQLGLNFRPETRLRIMPMIRSNVGADTVAAIIACGMDQTDELWLMVDLGTNCEVVLGNRDRIIATSTAAGPAFEGANIRQGMRASPGAIDRVSLRPRGRLTTRVLGNVRPRGLCGSALMDTASILLRSGVVDATGRMHGREALDSRRYPELASRLVVGESGHSALVLATHEEADRGIPVMLNAHDIRQLQLIKGSINAGAQLLMHKWGIGPEKLDRILIAGAFGSYLRKSSVMDIGLVPQIDPERVQFIGNAAGVGARMALVDRNAWQRAEAIREHAEYLELGGHPDYTDAFGMAMGFFDSPAIAEPESAKA